MSDKNLKVARTILEAMHRIDAYCDYIARTNLRRAEQSCFSEHDTQQIMEQIIDKTYKSQQLQLLKYRTEKQLSKAPEKFKRVMELFFLKNKSHAEVAVATKLGLRTVYRRIDEGVAWFANHLSDSCMIFSSMTLY